MINVDNTNNDVELQDYNNLNSNEYINSKHSMKFGETHSVNENDNLLNISFKNKKENLDNILNDINSVNTENKNLISIKENEEFLQETKNNYNHLKESAYENENNNDNDLKMEFDDKENIMNLEENHIDNNE